MAPTAYAPFSIPARKTKLSLEYPVLLFHCFQTNSLDAYPPPANPGMTAQTMIVTKKPTMMRKDPSRLISGRERCAKMTVKQHPHDRMR